MSIPLIQDNQKDSINASLIAIKREEERLQALIAEADKKIAEADKKIAEADKKIAELNELKVSKSDIVDEVTSGNMQSVTSNAVAEITKVKVNPPFSFSYTMRSGYSSTLIKIENIFKVGHLYSFVIDINNISGSNIGTSGTAFVANSNLRPAMYCQCIGIEYTSGRPVRIGIGVDGIISVMESTSITSGNNNIRAIMIYPS